MHLVTPEVLCSLASEDCADDWYGLLGRPIVVSGEGIADSPYVLDEKFPRLPLRCRQDRRAGARTSP
ncbi:hypothetical protein [Streptomyces olivochromogenes]|uniref:hypothetical protein n=1 Tax=Streptomyces olivochromogenes TaxID=1963 RepID=UPI00367E6341